MAGGPIRYRSPEEDSARWVGFPFRDGDIVISTRSKSGTTWVQMICALLVFQTPDLPAPLGELSPWVDWLITQREELYRRLDAQSHRRFVKTHTPLDGIPLYPRATFIVVARHPLDMAVSLYHQSNNLNRQRIRELIGQDPPSEPSVRRPPLREWLRRWIASEVDPRQQLDSLPGVMMHLSDAWARRDQRNVVLVHYDDLGADLEGEMRRIAGLLQIDVPPEVWPQLVEAASFEAMRRRADELVPDRAGVLMDTRKFFRRGSSGAGTEILTSEDLDLYRHRTEQLATTDLLTWLHRDR